MSYISWSDLYFHLHHLQLVKDKECNFIFKCQMESLIFVICSFNDGQRFMRCCTDMHFIEDNIQHKNTKTKTPLFDQTKEEQQHKNEIRELRRRERQTPKTRGLNAFKHLNCELTIGTKRQKAEDGTKRNDFASIYSFLHKFCKRFMACFTCGLHSPS